VPTGMVGVADKKEGGHVGICSRWLQRLSMQYHLTLFGVGDAPRGFSPRVTLRQTILWTQPFCVYPTKRSRRVGECRLESAGWAARIADYR
jgi:hypothetical protein